MGDVTWVKASYQSIRGEIRSQWKHQAGHFRLEVAIPNNTTAEVQVPGASANNVKAPGAAHFLRQEGDRVIYEVVPGRHVFVSDW